MQNDRNLNKAAYFNRLTYQEQLEAIEQQGQALQVRQIPDFWIHLYAIGALFVELWVCQQNHDVMLLRVLSASSELDPYLQPIDLALHELLP
ncbi:MULTISPECIES: hypothetical protein [Spirosoma]|uniref:Uncharacterized protein n=1 Tax=Spirosoma liriopis TaxID=2937440 RepID=A0ABT0HKF0_9BACT|nr:MULTISPECIES: hypothetical protein [Spirosoma]MCK8492647.1 hypothetical protein [Spirosoma liriopis]UHG92115.1 hypothetical protein LQ777_04220 [Spirosoma oryzicola]